MKTGIVVVSYNHFPFTKYCIESILAHTPKDLYKLCLADNGSIDGTKEWANQLLDWEILDHFISNDSNLGACKAANQGKVWSLEDDETDSTIIMANDHVVTSGWLEPLREAPADHCNAFTFFSTPNMRRLDKEIGSYLDRYKVLRVRYLQEDDEDNMVKVLKDLYGNIHQFSLKFKERHIYKPYIEFKETDWTGLVYYNNYVIDKVGLKDEEFLKYDKASHADIDYKIRIAKAGFTFVVAMQSYVHHWGSITTRKTGLKNDGLYKNEESKAGRYYQEKWKRR
jgi:GT2 family glycosyltransferase